MIVGFQAQNTLGRRLVEGHNSVKIHGEMVEVNARVVSLRGFSAHADYVNILDYLGATAKKGFLKKVFSGARRGGGTSRP